MKAMNAQISYLGNLTPKIKHFLVKPEKTPFHFKPGQWVDVFVPIEGKNLSGYTIISSQEQKGHFELAIRESDFHPVTQYIHQNITSTHPIQISEAQGKFFLPDELYQKPLTFIAGGIGITPILSMIRSISKDNIKLLYSVSHEEDILFREEISPYALFSVTQKADPTWKGERKRINLEMLKKYNICFDSDFFICGPPQMIDDLKIELLNFGVAQNKIHREKWW